MPAKQHDFTKTEIKAGILVLASAAILVVFVGAVMGLRPSAATKQFHAYFTETGGLNRGADVRFGGLLVGRVTAVEPAPGRQSAIRTTVSVDANVPINEDSTTYITQTTLTAAKHLEITTGSDDAPVLEDGAEIPAGTGGLFGQLDAISTGVTDLLSDLRVLIGVHDAQGELTMAEDEQQTVSELMVTLSTLLEDMRAIIGVTDAEGEPVRPTDEQRTLSDIFVSVDDTVHSGNALLEDVRATINDNREDIDAILDSLNEVGANANRLVTDLNDTLETNRPRIDQALTDLNTIMADVSGLVDDLGGRIEGIADALQKTLENTEQLTGDTRYLLENNTPEIEDTILDLREMVRNLKEFSRVLANQPDAVIRGKRSNGR